MSDVQIVVRFNYAYGRYGAGDVAGFYEAQAERLLAMVNRRGEPLCQKLKVIKKAKMPGTPGGEPPTDLMNRRRKITSAGKSGSKMKRE